MAEIHDTEYDLPKGILKENKGLYILTGRDRGAENGYYNNSEFVQGNVLDILGTFIKNNDFYSTNSYNVIMNNLYGNRRLFPINQLNDLDANFSFTREVNFIYDGHNLKPKERIIFPTEIKPLEEISFIKDLEGFSAIAKNYLDATQKEADSIVKHLFN